MILYAVKLTIAHTNLSGGETMPKIKLLPIAISIAVALIFFALGRLLAIRWGNAGFWLAVILLTIFYASWWAIQRGNNRDK